MWGNTQQQTIDGYKPYAYWYAFQASSMISPPLLRQVLSKLCSLSDGLAGSIHAPTVLLWYTRVAEVGQGSSHLRHESAY